MDVRYPKIKVKLVGQDGNSFAILGAVIKAMRAAGLNTTQVKEFTDEATSGDYDHLLQTAMRFVNVS
jgi:hypothetical protein